jgi:hypothetical protein
MAGAERGMGTEAEAGAGAGEGADADAIADADAAGETVPAVFCDRGLSCARALHFGQTKCLPSFAA